MDRRDRESTAVIGALVVVALSIAAATSAVRSIDTQGEHSAVLSRGPVFVAAPAVVAPLPSPASLATLLGERGYTLPAGVSVYAAEVVSKPGPGVRRIEYQGGAGAYDDSFWPASSVKLLAALGALDFLRSLGFTGAATIETDDGWTDTVRELADDAIEESSNEAYDMLVQVAGFDRLNTTFLSPANGFPESVIQRSYSGIDIRSSPAMTISESGITRTVPARDSTSDYECPDRGNCSNLFELAYSVERVVFDAELPHEEQLKLDPLDIRALTGDLKAADTFIQPGVKRALGNSALVYGKPGWVSGLDCVDVGAIDDLSTGRTFLLSVSSPDTGPGCTVFEEVAEQVLTALEAEPRD